MDSGGRTGDVVVDVLEAAPAPLARAAASAPPAAAAAPSPAHAAAAAPPARAAAPPPAPAAAAPPPVQGAAAQPAPAAPVAAVAAAAPPAPAPAQAPAAARMVLMRPLLSRAALATGLFVLGLAAAALGLFAMTLIPADYSSLGSCAATGEEAASLRAKSKLLLLDAATQALAAAVALLAPARVFVLYVALVMGLLTAYNATNVIWVLVACHGHVEGVLSFHYGLFYGAIFLFAALLVKKLAVVGTGRE